MTDYGQFYEDKNDEESRRIETHFLKESIRLKEEARTKEEVIKKNNEFLKTPRCSGENVKMIDIIKYAKKLNIIRKEASDLGICLDELESVAKEIH